MELHPTIWRTCRVLAGTTRIRLLKQIAAIPDLTVSRLAQSTGISLSRASQELRRLNARGLVQAVRISREVRYRPIPDPQVPAARSILTALSDTLHRTTGSPEADCQRIASGFAHPHRVAIVRELLQRPRNAESLARALRIPQRTIQRHLGILRSRELIKRRQGVYIAALEGLPLARSLARLIKDMGSPH
jgi:DNA-binding transcriptional ArsR family regulator